MAVQPGAKPSTSAINGQIVGGTNATAGQVPYQVNLIMDSAFVCGGSLIASQWILTAAHCLYKYSAKKLVQIYNMLFTTQNEQFSRTSIVVRMGTINRRVSSEPNRVTMTSTSKIIHSQYNPETVYNDVALIRLPSNVTLNSKNLSARIKFLKYAKNIFSLH